MEESNKCYSYNGKGYYTAMYGQKGFPDFIGDKGFEEPPSIHKNRCSACNGTGLAGDNNLSKHPAPAKDSSKEWEEEFDDLIKETTLVQDENFATKDKADIKAFIKRVSQESKRQGAKECEESKNNAYRERDMLVCALSKLFPAYLARHDENDKDWEDDWRWIVYIEIPVREKVVSGDQHNHTPEKDWFKTENKQVSWHIHDSEREMFNHLEVKENNWDGHNTERKYQRLSALQALITDK